MNNSKEVNILQSKIKELELEIKNLHETVTFLTRKLYGKSSETSKSLDIQGQMFLFDEAEVESDPKAVEPTLEEVKEVIRKKYKGQLKDKLENLPHKKILFKLEEDDLSCEHCNGNLKSVGEEFVRSEVEYIPAKLNVIDYYRETYECRSCKNSDRPFMEKTPLPSPVISHSYASPSSVAYLIYQKFINALPYYRQEKDWKNLGLNLSRQTMSNWTLIAARDWLMPIVELLHKKLLEDNYLHADETRVQVLNEEERKNTTNSYMWVYGNYKESKYPIRIFEYHPTRSGDHAKDFLQGFSGYLVTDAYKGYEKVENITRAYCWSHARRYFSDSLPSDMKSEEANLPKEGIAYCNKLFAIEKELSDLSPEERKTQRQKKIKPVLEAFWSWVEINKEQCMPKSKLYKAFNYALNQKDGLMVFLEDGNISPSNNLAENSIRPFTIGRKNWLFSGSPKGAQASAAIYSIMETAKANNINPYKYLEHIFTYMPGMDFGENPEWLEDFLPWSLEVQNVCKNEASE